MSGNKKLVFYKGWLRHDSTLVRFYCSRIASLNKQETVEKKYSDASNFLYYVFHI